MSPIVEIASDDVKHLALFVAKGDTNRQRPGTGCRTRRLAFLTMLGIILGGRSLDGVLWVRMARSACRESMHSASAGKATCIYYWRWIF